VSIPRGGEPKISTVLEVFVHYVLESARVKKRLRSAPDRHLALEFWKGTAGPLRLTTQKSLAVNDQRNLRVIRRRACFLSVKAWKASTAAVSKDWLAECRRRQS